MKHTCFNRVLSALIALVMVIGFLPTGLIPVQTEAHAWNDSATMTLLADGQEVEPASIIETADTKLKVYTVSSDKNYTLQTSADNDYAVVFDVQWAESGEDEYGNIEYDTELDLELDNVTIRTYNPRQTVFADSFAALSIDTSTDWSNTVNLILTGENTVQLLGAQNAAAEEAWSAVHFGQCRPVIKGSGTLNAEAAFENAAGQVSAIDFNNYTQIAETVTINAVADAGTDQGNGITINYAGIDIAAGATLNITASKSGVVFVGTTKSYLTMNGQLNIKAADHGIDWQAYSMTMGDGAKLTVAGLTEGTAPKVGVLTTRGVTIGANCTVTVNALNEAFSCTAPNATSDYSAPISIGENSVVTVSGAVESNVYALDCGYKTAHNSYWQNASYPASTLTLAAGAKLTVNAGYRAIQVLSLDMASTSALYVNTSKVVNSNSTYECSPVHIYSTDSYIREDATLEINTDAESAINGYATLNFLSDDIYIKSGGVAMSGLSITRGDGIITMESEDGDLWRPFSKSSKQAYLTTHAVEKHQCYNETVTPVADTDTHSMVCLYCGKETITDCQWDYGSWYNTSEGVLLFKCKLCKQEKYVNVPYHTHVYETWTPVEDDYNQKHEARCTYPGCGAGTYNYCSGYYGQEYHVNLTTMRHDCTLCGQYQTWEIEGAEASHVEAKAGNCSTPGNVEFWYCGHCNQYYADENCTKKLSPVDAFTTPGPHSYDANGVCTVCGDKTQNLSFWQHDDSVYSKDGYYFVLVGKAPNGKMYVMGNQTADGKRAGVEIPDASVDENGILTISSADAEYLLRDDMNDAFVVDGGYLSLLDGQIFVYNTARKDDKNLPYPGTFQPYDYSDGSGLGHISAYLNGQYSNRKYLVFNADTLTFEVSDTQADTLYLYVQLCDHPNMAYTRETPATCTKQGCKENWYCDKCQTYYSNAAGTALLEMPEYCNPQEFLTIPAVGHKFGADEKCENCGMDKPVYAPVTTVEDFDNLGPDAYYLIVFRDGDKTYAAALPPQNHYWDDMDGNGEYDLFATDENANEIPDCIETVDLDQDGTLDILQDYNGDEVITQDDYMFIYEQLAYRADEAMWNSANFVEVTLSEDGTISLADEGAMEFQLQAAGIWGGMPVDEEGYGDHEIQDNERIRAAWVPNYWVAAGGNLSLYGPDQFRMQNRFYGDHAYPGLVDMKNWKISFREDGTLCMVDSWSEYDDTAALQMVFYVNDMGEPVMTVFSGPEMEWEYSPVYSTMTKTLPAYLYAATPAGTHTCEWGEWIADEGGQTHTRTCEGCGNTETADHRWNAGEIVTEATCEEAGSVIYTCLDCKAVRTEVVEALGHKWVEHEAVEPGCETEGNIAYRQCATCGAAESLGENPVPLGKYGWVLAPTGHAMEHHEAIEPTCTENGHLAFDYCTNCQCFYYEDPLMLTYQAGVILAPGHDYIDHEGQAPTCEEAGWAAYQTCTNCDFTSYEALSATGHKMTEWTHVNINTHTRFCANGCGLTETEDHKWSEWTTDGEKTHTKTCTICGGTRTELHVWNSEVISANTCTADGQVRYTCQFCDETYTTVIPAGHAWSEWEAKPDGSYYRACSGCQAEEWMNLPEERPVNNTPADNAASSNLEGSDIELIDQILTQEEQSQVAAGAEVSIYLVVEDISEEVSEEDQEAAAELMEEDSQVGMYLDINLFKQVEQEQTQVSETNKEVAITIVIPEELRTTAEGIERSYQIIRVHDAGNGVLITDVIQGTYNPEDGTFTFYTDKFSTYALVYTDEEKASLPGDYTGDGQATNADVVALMWHVLFPTQYPLEGDADLNHDGQATNADVVALMWYVLFPEQYPLG